MWAVSCKWRLFDSVLGVVAVVGGGPRVVQANYTNTGIVCFRQSCQALYSTTPGWGRGRVRYWRRPSSKEYVRDGTDCTVCYRRADRDGDGRISVQEILTVFKVSNISQNYNITYLNLS